MPVDRIAIDGLWRCLCPSIDNIVLSYPIRQSLHPKRPFARSRLRSRFAKCLQARDFSITNRRNKKTEDFQTAYVVRGSGDTGLDRFLSSLDEKSPKAVFEYTLEKEDRERSRRQAERANKSERARLHWMRSQGVTPEQPLITTLPKHFDREGKSESPQSRVVSYGGKVVGGGNPQAKGIDEKTDNQERLRARELWLKSRGLVPLRVRGLLDSDGSSSLGELKRKADNPSSRKQASNQGGNPSESATESGRLAYRFGRGSKSSGDDGGWNPWEDAVSDTLKKPSQETLDGQAVIGRNSGSETDRSARSKPPHGPEILGGVSAGSNESLTQSQKLVKLGPSKWFFGGRSFSEEASSSYLGTPNGDSGLGKSKLSNILSHLDNSGTRSAVTRANNGAFFTSSEPSHERSTPELPFKIRPGLKSAFTQAIRERQGVELLDGQELQARKLKAIAKADQRKAKARERSNLPLWKLENWDVEKIPTLHDRLRACWTQEGQYDHVVALVEYLLKNRGEVPTLIHYDALIKANADAEKGSAESVRALLQEMKATGLKGDSGLYHGVLQALAIHPDYELRADVMQEMKERWFGLSPEGWHSLVTGLLRDRQIEMALDKLQQMHTDEIVIQPWLYDIFTYVLCELGELDEAYKLFLYRYEHSRFGISVGHWQYLLDKFSSAFHYNATKQIWDTRVQAADLIPSDGTCAAVLNLAARNSDPTLATSVIQVLSARKTPLTTFHYEALVAAYAGIEDTRTAFRVLAIMEKAGLDPSSSSTRPLYNYLSTSDEVCHNAWDILNSLRKDGHNMPLTAVNVVLEALCKCGKVDEAYKYYKRLHEICPRGPNTETINTILQGLQREGDSRKGRAMFLASEMQALKIKPDMLTYDRLIMVCLRENDYEDAFRYLEEMEEVGRESVENNRMGWWMRPGTAAMMVRVCARYADQRALSILKKMEERGMAQGQRLRTVIEKQWGLALKEEEEGKNEGELIEV